jgi:hypothetical protein
VRDPSGEVVIPSAAERNSTGPGATTTPRGAAASPPSRNFGAVTSTSIVRSPDGTTIIWPILARPPATNAKAIERPRVALS